ncbi:MAG: ATP-binding protein [Desulfobacteraceae bacterium]|nr:ATP-binding protein [Desulfobacteraceae bacterium]
MTQEVLISLLSELCALPAETEWMEFKKAKNNIHFDDLGKYFSAISNEANLKGLNIGWFVLGISDQPPRKIVGTYSYVPDPSSVTWGSYVVERELLRERRRISGPFEFEQNGTDSWTGSPGRLVCWGL